MSREYLLLASYCGDDNARCSEARPCDDCLAMCNIFKLDGDAPVYLRELGEFVSIEESSDVTFDDKPENLAEAYEDLIGDLYQKLGAIAADMPADSNLALVEILDILADPQAHLS